MHFHTLLVAAVAGAVSVSALPGGLVPRLDACANDQVDGDYYCMLPMIGDGGSKTADAYIFQCVNGDKVTIATCDDECEDVDGAPHCV